MRPMRVVTPFRPFEPESQEHLELGPFNWLDAIAMLRDSVARSCRCDTVTITDQDAEIPGPIFAYRTKERRLMLWILEVSLKYLSSRHFDRDTVFISPDSLVYTDLRLFFHGDLGMVIRPDHDRPILNGLQWWPVASKTQLVDLYERALFIGKSLPDDLKIWGADSEPFRLLLQPLVGGCAPRAVGLTANLMDSRMVLFPFTSSMQAALEAGESVDPPPGVVDFRYLRKRYMRAYFEATLGAEVLA